MAAYHALIASHILHMLPIYGGAPAASRARVSVFQKRAIEVAMSLPLRTDSRLVYKGFRTLPIDVLRNIEIVLLVCPILHTLSRPLHLRNTVFLPGSYRDYTLPLVLATRCRLPSHCIMNYQMKSELSSIISTFVVISI